MHTSFYWKIIVKAIDYYKEVPGAGLKLIANTIYIVVNLHHGLSSPCMLDFTMGFPKALFWLSVEFPPDSCVSLTLIEWKYR